MAEAQSEFTMILNPLILTQLDHESVVNHYDIPRKIGQFDYNDSDVGTGLVEAMACGDAMKLQIKVNDKTKKIALHGSSHMSSNMA